MACSGLRMMPTSPLPSQIPYGAFSPVRLQGRLVRQGLPVRRSPRVDQFAFVLRAPRCPRLIPVLCRGTWRAETPPFERLLPALPQGPSLRSGFFCPGPSTLNRPHPPHSQAHPDFTAQRLIRDVFAVHTSPRRPPSGSTLSLPFLPAMQPVCSRHAVPT
jgi:hypothetical protein